MKVGDVILISLAQASGGPAKLRPPFCLPDFRDQNLLICGISTQLQQVVDDWDERVAPGDGDFPLSGLHRESAIRLSYLYSATTQEVVGAIGRIDPARLGRLRARLIKQLQS